jgi:UDP-N-acetylmuramoyl-tripeptide--D-alanyl-D-alanine ligase
VLFRSNLNNDIGCPLSLLQIDAATGIAVIEMGANHPGEIAGLCKLAQPTESAITMIAPAHLEGFGTIEGVAKAKAEIINTLPPKGIFYENVDDPWCRQIGDAFDGEMVRFGSSGDVVLEWSGFIGPGELELQVSPVGTLRLPLACRAHAANVLLAIAVGLRHGATEFEQPLREACMALSRFQVFSIGPLTVMDDSYNANPASMAAPLQALVEWPGQGARIAALGEMLELGEEAPALHRQMGALAGELGVTHLFAAGQHACDTIEAAQAAHVPYTSIMEDPLALALAIHQVVRRGDLLLVKGSRGMRMERVIDGLRNLYA